jgi:hypothetical protein
MRAQAPVPEIIDPVFAKTSQNARFLLIENERFRLVFVKTGARNYGPSFQENKPKTLLSMTEYERFGLVFTKTRVYKFGHGSINSVQEKLNHDKIL